MHWKFEPFFSIDIFHGKYPPPAVGQSAPPAPVFSVEPTQNTRARFLRMGWTFKPFAAGGGGTVHAEKVFASDGTAKLRVRPAQDEGFSFLIRLTDNALLNQTKPFMRPPTQAEMDAEPDPLKKNNPKPNETLPPFSGRARLLYFDNLKAVQVGGTFPLTAGNTVSIADFGSRFPTAFTFMPVQTTVTQVGIKAYSPGSTVQNFTITSKGMGVEIKLPENGYHFMQQPSNQSETLFLSSETLPADLLGVVRIFQPPNADWEPFRRYQIMFDKV